MAVPNDWSSSAGSIAAQEPSHGASIHLNVRFDRVEAPAVEEPTKVGLSNSNNDV